MSFICFIFIQVPWPDKKKPVLWPDIFYIRYPLSDKPDLTRAIFFIAPPIHTLHLNPQFMAGKITVQLAITPSKEENHDLVLKFLEFSALPAHPV